MNSSPLRRKTEHLASSNRPNRPDQAPKIDGYRQAPAEGKALGPTM